MKIEIGVAMLIGALALSGCGGGADLDMCYYTQSSEQRSGATGLTLAPSKDMYVSFADMERFYTEMQNCTGIHPAAGPTVYYKRFAENNLGQAWAFQTQNVIWVNTDQALNRNCHSDEQALKHEFVHYLLYASGVPADVNANHDSAYLEQCAPGVRTENGIPY